MTLKKLHQKLSNFFNKFHPDNRKPKWCQPILKHGEYAVHPITGKSFGWRTWQPSSITIKTNVDIGAGCELFGHHGIIVHENVQIGGGTMIYSANTINRQFAPVIINRNAKIGANSVILPGSIIKENQMIKALSVVYFDGKETIIK